MANKRYDMHNKCNVAVLASTNATDLDAIVASMNAGEIPIEIGVLISNKENAGCIERAKRHGIEVLYINNKDFADREAFDRKVAEELEKRNIDLILLIGYMRYLSNWFVEKYRNRIMNVHPSLLPAFAGGMDTNVHQAVLDAGVEVTGATIHFVDEGADTGPIIAQKEVAIEKGETVDSLKAKVQAAEQELFPQVIKLFCDGKLKVIGNRVEVTG